MIERFLIKNYDISFALYEHLDLPGKNIPDVLIDSFGELKDDINEKSYIYCEKLFEINVKKSKNYNNILNYVKGDRKIDNFIKKELLIVYCRKYLTLFEVMRRLYKENMDTSFILSGDYFSLWDIYTKDHGGLKAKHYLKLYYLIFDKVASVIFGLIAINLIMVSNAIRIRLIPQKRYHDKKFIWVAPGLTYDFLKNFFKETSSYKSKISCKNTLFIWDGIDAAGNMEKYLRENKITSIKLGENSISFSYFIKEVIWGSCLQFLVRQWISALKSGCNMFFVKLNYSLVKNVIDYDSLAVDFPPKVFFISRYYESRNAIKTIVVNRYGGKTVAFQFGNIAHPMQNVFLYSYSCLNHFLLYGEGSKEFKDCGHKIDVYHPIGSDRVDLSIRLKERRLLLRKKFGIGTAFAIVVFGPAYNDTIPRRKNVLKFYRAILDSFIQLYSNELLLIIKPHYKSENMSEGEKNFPELADLLDTLRAHNNVRFYYHENPYELMVAADFVLTWSYSTTGIEAIATGKNTLFFDPMQSRFQPYREFHEKIVINESVDLCNMLKSALDKSFPIDEQVYEKIRRKYCYPNDGFSVQRLLNKISDIADGFSEKAENYA